MWLDLAGFLRIDSSRRVENAAVGGSHGRLADCFEDLADPRTGNAGRHDLVEIMVIALCTALCGGQYASDMELFAREKEAFLRSHGWPSHDRLIAMHPAGTSSPKMTKAVTLA